jgi:VanZ family protein
VKRLSGRGGRVAAAASLVVWCVAIWTLSSKSDPEDFVGVSFKLNDKVAHGIAYAAGGFLAAWAAGSPVRRLRTLCVAIVFCALWGVSDEIHQSFVPGRESSGLDVAADVVGGAVGAALAVRLLLGRSRPASGTMNPVA